MPSISALLLRVVLCLGLVLNGQGSAVASIEMAGGHHGAAAPAASSGAAAPCGHHEASRGLVAPASAVITQDAAAADHAHPGPDCCKSGACNCACAHYASSVTPVGFLVGVDITAAGNVCPLRPGRASPAHRNLIRPPIG